jgi:ribonuclease BN (tRNA processing enzyme)
MGPRFGAPFFLGEGREGVGLWRRRGLFYRRSDAGPEELLIFVQNRSMSEQQQASNQLNIEISEEVAEGQYANLVIITHSHAEFVMDFVNVMPGTPKSKVKSRLILTPQHAKRFMKALTENIVRFEAANGKIQDLEEVQLPMNFGGPSAQA